MHEIGIASAVLDTVRGELRRHPHARVRRVGLLVGEWSGVDAEALRFCLEALVRDTDLAEAALDIDRRPRRNCCRACATDFAVVDYDVRCPACGALDTVVSGGTELEVAFLELEESAGAESPGLQGSPGLH